MTQDSDETRSAIVAFGDRYLALRQQHRGADLTPFLLAMLDETGDEDVRDQIRSTLRQEYLLHGNIEAATKLALQAIAKRPLAPMPLLALVSQKHYSEGNPAAALPLAIEAVALADAAREFRRHARATLLRVAAALGDTDLVRSCMVEIMNLTLTRGEPDVGREADVLALAEKAGVEREILDRYAEFLRPSVTAGSVPTSDAGL